MSKKYLYNIISPENKMGDIERELYFSKKEKYEKELKRKAFLEKANKNKANFDLHRDLIEKHLCNGNKMYYEDLKVFAERQVIDNMLLLKLMEYAEEYAFKNTLFCKITKSQIESIYNVKEDIKAMLGCSDDDYIWKKHIKNIESFLLKNKLK